MANPNAPHGCQPVQNGDSSPYNGRANLYHIPAADAVAYYNGDIVVLASTGSDANGVPDIALAGTRGTATAATVPVGVIVGIQVAPIGVGAGATQNNAVNLNQQYVPASKAQDYYVWVADDPGLVMEIQLNNTATVAAGSLVNLNVGYLPTAPSNTVGPLSATVATATSTGAPATTATLPLKILGLPYRPNVDFTANIPLLVTWNVHQYGKPSPGTAGV